jgi:hypothetical protein
MKICKTCKFFELISNYEGQCFVNPPLNISSNKFPQNPIVVDSRIACRFHVTRIKPRIKGKK